MTKQERAEEQEARQNPTCQKYRELSLKLSYRLRGRISQGFEYSRQAVNSYGITIRKGNLRYYIWFLGMNGPENVKVCLDRRTRPSRGITTDPDLKVLVGAGGIDDVLQALKAAGVTRC